MKMLETTAAGAALAYEEIKQGIIELRYPPGSKLSEVRLAEELGCGRSPVRSAFARLQSEGWIEVSPQSGTYVRAPTEREIEEIFECRELLEAHVAGLAALKMHPDQVKELRAALRRLKPAGKVARNFSDLSAFDSLLHATLYRAAGNALISEILLNLLEKAQWVKNCSPSGPRRMNLWSAELERVLDAIENRDAQRAAEKMREHIANASPPARAKWLTSSSRGA